MASFRENTSYVKELQPRQQIVPRTETKGRKEYESSTLITNVYAILPGKDPAQFPATLAGHSSQVVTPVVKTR